MRRFTTRVRLTFCALSLIIASLVNPIYVPGAVDKKTLNNLGIKTLGWQTDNQRVVVHHNYSKVHNAGFSRQPPVPHSPPRFDQEETTTSEFNDQLAETTTDLIKWQRINDQLTELAAQGFEADQKSDNQSQFEQMAQEWQTLGSKGQGKQKQTEHEVLLKTINDHLSQFDQLTQDFDPQSDQDQSHFNQTGRKINDQSSGLNQEADSSNLDQEESRRTEVSGSGFDQEVQGQKWSNLGQEGVTRINDQLSGFESESQRFDHDLPGFDQESQQHQWLNLGTDQIQGHQSSSFDDQRSYNDDQTSFVRQEVKYYDGRQFTNAHSGGHQPVRTEKLVRGSPKLYYDQPITYKQCPKQATGQFPYELSCNQFLNCWKGRGYIQNCAPGTLFNPKTLECDFPEKVACVSGPRQTPFDNREPLSAALQATCPPDFTGIIPHYVDCAKFINCVNGVEFAMSCGPGTLFDVKTNLCDHAYKAECANQESTSDSRFHQGFANKYIVVKPYREGGTNSTYHRQYLTTGGSTANQRGQSNLNVNDRLDEFIRQMEVYGSTNQSEHDNRFANKTEFGQGSHGFVQGREDQNRQPFTSDGTSANQYEQSGVNINDHLDEFIRQVQIYGATDQSTNDNRFTNKTGFEEGRLEFVQGGEGTNQFPSQTIDSSASHAFGRRPDQSGAPNQNFNQFGGGTNLFGGGTNQFGASSNQFGSSSNQFHPLGGGSSQLGSGYNQFGRTTSSGHGLNINLFDLEKEIRNLGFDVSSYCRNHAGLSEHPKNCSLFLFCDAGNLMIFPCEIGSFFNPQTRACDLNYQCPKRSDDVSPISKPKCPSDYVGLLPHPMICAKFLNCNNGQTFIQDCGPGTVFNPELKVCDYPYRVRCAVQTVSEDNQGYPSVASQNRSLAWNQNQNTRWQTSTQNLRGSSGAANQNQNWRWNQSQNQYNQTQLHGGDQLGTGSQRQNWWSNQNNQQQNTNLQRTGGWNQHGQSNLHDGGDQLGASIQNQNRRWNQSQNQYNQTQLRGGGDQLGTSNQHQNWWSNQNNRQQNTNLQSTGWNQHGQSNFHDGGDQSGASSQNQNWQIANAQSGSHGGADQLGASSQNQNRWPNQNQNNQWQFTRQNQSSRWNQNQNWHHAKPQTINQTWNTRRTNQELTPIHTQSLPKHSPPPFPSTDTNADYVFEDDDADEVEVPDRKRKNFCQIDDFRCSDDVCISQSMVCDTYKDCPDGKDEVNCEKYVEQFSVVSGTKMALREKGKFPNVTLTFCAKYCMESRGYQCKAFNYRKNDGTCFIFDTNVGLSGGLFMLPNYDYYEYSKFTVDCSAKYKCTNQKCVDFEQVCDGVNDCGDRGDEKGCKAEQLGYSVRLVGSGKRHEGVVEVSAFGRSGYVCDDMFGLRDAHVVCNELGFPLGALEVHGNSFFAPQAKPNETFYMMDDVSCLGNETSLRDCDFSGWGVHNCIEQEIIGVVCKTPLEKCPKDYWRCETGNECLPLAFVCDAVDDCEDKSDEGSQYCEAPIELRLVGGGSKLEGRVEIRYHGTWGTICDDDFNDDAAKVVCKYLGHHGAAQVRKDAYFGKGDGPIWLDQIYCQGNETAIQECLHWDWGEHNCEHTEDVGVICSDDQDETFQIEAQRNAKLPVLSKALFPERCGYRSDAIFLEDDDVHFRVVKGSAARKGDYPWQASLRVKGKTKPTHWCGAVVISDRFLLTTAHCLDGFTKGAYIVVAGDYNVDVDEGSEQVAYIEDFYTHEQFRNGTRMNNDIALVKLKGNGFNFTKEVQPICLPDADFNQEKGMNCTISGFGSVQSGKAVASKELRAGWIPILARDVCKMPHIYGDAITDGMICAGSLDEGVDACDGDSGGPLACLHDGFFTLIGLTSWGQHCGYANKPGVYVRIAHYRDWIDNTMKQHS